MQKYFDNVTSRGAGIAVAGALVTVTVTATGALATIYADNGVTTKDNPLTTDPTGYFEFYAANGRYTLTITGGFLNTKAIQDVLLEDITGTGSSLVGFSHSDTNPAGSIGAKAHQVIHVKDAPYNAACDGVTDDTTAVNAAITAAFSAGVGEVRFSGTLLASQITLKRFVVLSGDGVGTSELKQISGSNKDFVISENFAALTGTGLSVSGDSRVPSFFGLANCRVNGNKAGNSSGRGIAWYGAAQITRGIVLVYGTAGNGIFTEYTTASGSSSWQGQEEGQFDNMITRDCGGIGWDFNGPHNSRINSIESGFNGSWGFQNRTTATSDGGIDYIGLLHTYANGSASAPAADTGSSIGEICRIGALISDGDNVAISASSCLISEYRGFNVGGQLDGLTISGNNNTVGIANLQVWASSTGKRAVYLTGLRNKIGAVTITTANAANDGIVIDGAENQVAGIHVQGFSGAGQFGVNLNASSCRIVGEISACATGFNYTAANQNNRVDLYISTSAGQLAVAGTPPGATDMFDIRASGAGQAGKTRSCVQTATFAMDTTTAATITIAHGLLYTPSKQQIALTLLQSSPDSSSFDMGYIRVNTVDATNVVIGYKLTTAATAGVLGRIGVVAQIN